MSTGQDVDRIVRSWLRADGHESADHPLELALAVVATTPQRRPWSPWRFGRMNRLSQALIAAAAVLLLLIAGYTIVPHWASSGGPAPSPSAMPSAVPLPSGSIGPGTYRVSDAAIAILPYTFTVPAGWTGGDGASRGDAFGGTGVELTTWHVTHVYRDSCNWSGTLVPVTTRDQLIAALVAQTGHAHSAPVEATIGGISTMKIELSLDPAFDMSACGGRPIVRLWPDPGPDEGGGWGLTPGETVTAYAFEANGNVGVLMTVQHVGSPPADVAALEGVLRSVHFEQ